MEKQNNKNSHFSELKKAKNHIIWLKSQIQELEQFEKYLYNQKEHTINIINQNIREI